MWSQWYTSVMTSVKALVPTRTLKPSRDPPWFDGEARHALNRRNTARRLAKRTNRDADWAHFRSLRNATKMLLRSKQKDYIDSLDELCRTNPKRFWSYFKNKTGSSSLPSEITYGEESSSDPAMKATLMNSYFGSVFQTSPDAPPDHAYGPTPLPISTPSFSVDEVISILKRTNISSAQPPNDIPSQVLKHCAHALAPSLAILFNVSIARSVVPSPWKVANVVPIFKKGDKHNVCNYRPISLLPIASKCMERCVFEKLYSHVQSALHPLQHGFVKGRSCTSQLLLVYHDIGRILDRGGQVDIIYLDFSKAFDCVPHNLLLYKLRMQFGISNELLDWILSYLTSRSQRVLIDGKMSDFIPVTSGVPQGSILGPLLFLLYINDMPTVSNSPTALFADDSKCFRPVSSTADCDVLQNDLDNFYAWSQTWRMSFNSSKCEVMSFSRSRNPTLFNYQMNNVDLKRVNVFTDLGISIDFKLGYSNHVDRIASKASRVCGMVKRAVGFRAPTKVKLTLFNSYARPILETSSQVWSPHYKRSILKIESVQRSMSKFILNDFISSYSVRCRELNILPLCYRREIADLIFAFKILYDLMNVDFNNALHFQSAPNRNLRSFDSFLIESNRTDTETFLASYFNRTPRLWNILPHNIRSTPSLHIFKEQIYLHYFDKFETHFNVDNSCTLTSLCRCTGFYH